MLEPAKIPVTKVRNSIVVFAAISCGFYILFLLLMQAFDLMHVTGLRVVNYLFLFAVCFAGIRRWIYQSEHFVPFLTVFTTCLVTGVLSFIMFGLFLMIYSGFNTELNDLFNRHAPDALRSVPTAMVLFEGTAVSIIVAFINMQYFRRYEEGEASPERKHHHPQQHSSQHKLHP
jgi:hypothetical protein